MNPPFLFFRSPARGDGGGGTPATRQRVDADNAADGRQIFAMNVWLRPVGSAWSRPAASAGKN